MTAPLDLRCSAQARRLGLDAGGTAVAAGAFLLVEAALPWPADIADHPELDGVAAVAAELGARLQGLVTEPGRRASDRRLVVLHRSAGGPFRRYVRTETSVPVGGVIDGIRALAAATGPDRAPVDVLVCTHGSRDRCCGSLGTALSRAVTAPEGVVVRRTSHLGGHRFAPTALVLPEGTAWAWLDEHVLGDVLTRSVEPAAVIGHYRGSTAMPTPVVQVAERAVLAEVGWAWLDQPRAGWAEPAGPDRWVAHIEGGAGAWEAVVERSGTTPQPVCGHEPAAGGKTDEHLRLIGFRQQR